MGNLLDKPRRADHLAHYAERVLREVRVILQNIPINTRPGVYYGRGPDGLETGGKNSINVELLDVVGARNVAADAVTSGLVRVSMEQIFGWDPEVIITLDERFFRVLSTSDLWRDAVKRGRIYLAPRLPFGWFDRPPWVNRLIGIQWLLAVLYPNQVHPVLHAQAKEFYRDFYHIELNETELHELLENAL